MASIQEEDKIAPGLKRIRSLRMWLVGMIITFAPVVYFLSMLDYPQWFFMTIGIIWIGTAVLFELIIGFSRCPACRNYFHVRGMSGSMFTKKCMNCGIPLKNR